MEIIKSLLTGIATVSVCSAQIVNISGFVTDTGGTAIPGSIVKLEKGGQTATTGIDGSFTLSGPTNSKPNTNQTILQNLSAMICNGVLSISLAERTEVEIRSYTMQGKVVSTVQQTMDAGTSSLALPQKGAGVCFYTVKTDKSFVVLKSISLYEKHDRVTASFQGSSSRTPAKEAKAAEVIDDVIAVTKTGFLNYRDIETNSNDSGKQIKMIVCADTVTDADGNVYQAVRIGSQVWTVENLRTTKYNDGTPVTFDTLSADWELTGGGNGGDSSAAKAQKEKYCYYKNTSNADSIKKFGALYNWGAVKTNKLAPAGWHVPTIVEWDTLHKYLLAVGLAWSQQMTSDDHAPTLAARTDWVGGLGNNNKTGFSALPGGIRTAGIFTSISSFACFWSDSEYAYYPVESANYEAYNFEFSNNFMIHSTEWHRQKESGMSVRLVRD
jgi:uncharacterized protein (TIGR02145 family)